MEMKYNLRVEHTFAKEAKRLGKRYPSLKSDVAALGAEIMRNPRLGTDLGGGLRKIRLPITSKGRGKSGGARVISYTVVVRVDETDIHLLTIYDKSERESISKSELRQLLEKNGLL